MSQEIVVPKIIPNWVNGKEVTTTDKKLFNKINPHNGKVIASVVRSNAIDVCNTIAAAEISQKSWAILSPPRRGEILRDIALGLQTNRDRIARIVALETGKSLKDALGETDGAIALGFFMAGEGQRMYGKTTTSSVENRHVMIVREPIGIAGLIIAANTPIANIAWKVFPALICGNSAVLKASEDTPITAWYFGLIAHQTGLPPGVLNIIQGYGEEAGEPLVRDTRVGVISFTGSTEVGKKLAVLAGERLARLSLELGGKNPLIVCEDADLENAVQWSILSSFSNAGQRCASASRIIIIESLYEKFREMLLAKTKLLRIGPNDTDDYGPVINLDQLLHMINQIENVRLRGGKILTGGYRLMDEDHKNGYYLAPTIIENVDLEDEVTKNELFGPITCLYPAKNFQDAIDIANNSNYGLTASIHTLNINRAMLFSRRVQAGVVVINGGTLRK